MYRSCDPAADLRTIRARIADAAPGGPDDPTIPSEDAIAASLRELAAAKLVLELGGRWLSLALRGDVPAICGLEDFPGGQVALPGAIGSEAIDRFAERSAAWARTVARPEAAA